MYDKKWKVIWDMIFEIFVLHFVKAVVTISISHLIRLDYLQTVSRLQIIFVLHTLKILCLQLCPNYQGMVLKQIQWEYWSIVLSFCMLIWILYKKSKASLLLIRDHNCFYCLFVFSCSFINLYCALRRIVRIISIFYEPSSLNSFYQTLNFD